LLIPFAKVTRTPLEYPQELGIEASNVLIPGCECDLGHGQLGFDDEPLGKVEPPRLRNGAWRCSEVLSKEPAQVSVTYAQPLGELGDRSLIECTFFDEAHAAGDRR